MGNDHLSGRVQLIRWVFTVLAVLFFSCVVIQVFLAGVAVFVDYGQWNYHRSFIHFFEFIPVVMLLVSFFGRIPKHFRWQCAALFAMIILQYVTTQVLGSVPYISALHPIIALILFWRSLVMTREAFHLMKKGK
ncbi:DUF6220 domain-containing protein [Alkalihalobacillus sp. AL-G]|uniref:DUF6220 domain-containing protein n=1 Tax=Alkalihalobacillus sp. AL-G TaxID=2926399 RepID=UPI00272C6D68|nr:DUF6220 domain-containing protein [Alkalihalobacillus sp. AL-G]WLD91677.1 DUF6220 domain-containing protein [Alkalihalobacillus sp. AL-G]